MRKLFLILLISLIAMTICIQPISASTSKPSSNPTIKTNVKTFNEFIPVGWKLNYKVQGDLNNDKLIDVAAVIEQDIKYSQGDEIAPVRMLIIAFKQKNNTYSLSYTSTKATLKANEGGVFGDPFYEGLKYSNGSLLINFYGGSNDRWGLTYRFRFQNKGWYLIGATILALNAGSGKETINDYNLLTGKMIISKGQEGGKLVQTAVSRGKKKLLNIKAFNPWVVAGKDY